MYVRSVDIVIVADITQTLLPIAEQQESKRLARDNTRLLNCWLGMATRDDLGKTFCHGCEFLDTCKRLYRLFDGARGMHPSARAREVLIKFGIRSEYL